MSDGVRRTARRKCAVPAWVNWRSPFWTLLLLTMVILLVMLNLWGLRPFGYGVVDYQRFGDIATWAQAIGTVGAIVAALRQIQQQRTARSADIARQDKRERTQVYCWMTFRDDIDAAQPGWYLHFNNLTPLPISVWVLHVQESATGVEIGVLDVSRFDPIPPGFSRVRTGIASETIDQPICALDFVDHAGECWSRRSSGPLIAIDAIRLAGQTMAASADSMVREGFDR